MKSFIANPDGQPGFRVMVRDEKSGPAFKLNPRFDLKMVSQNGFAWGYQCPECDQLALALLAAVTTTKRALARFEQFSRDVVATWPPAERWRVNEKQILHWITTTGDVSMTPETATPDAPPKGGLAETDFKKDAVDQLDKLEEELNAAGGEDVEVDAQASMDEWTDEQLAEHNAHFVAEALDIEDMREERKAKMRESKEAIDQRVEAQMKLGGRIKEELARRRGILAASKGKRKAKKKTASRAAN